MTDYSDWEYIFTSSWCPVSGEIPGAPNSFELEGSLSEDPLDRLGLVIEESRRLLQVYPCFPFDLLEYDDKRPNMTREEYEKAYLNDIEEAAANAPSDTLGYIGLIRSIFASSRSIYQYLDYYKYGPGYVEQRFTKQLIDSARSIFPRKTPGFVILAVLAIEEAYYQAYDLVLYDKKPNPEKAFHLLWAAEKMAAVDDYVDLEKFSGDLENKIQEIEPLAAKELAAQRHRQEGGKEKARLYAEKNQLLIRRAEELKNKRPKLSRRSAAKIIENETGVSLETIRKIKEIKDLFPK